MSGNEQIKSKETMVMVHRDANGNIKPIFQENALFLWALRKGILKPTFPKIPFILGRWQEFKEITVDGNH